MGRTFSSTELFVSINIWLMSRRSSASITSFLSTCLFVFFLSFLFLLATYLVALVCYSCLNCSSFFFGLYYISFPLYLSFPCIFFLSESYILASLFPSYNYVLLVYVPLSFISFAFLFFAYYYLFKEVCHLFFYQRILYEGEYAIVYFPFFVHPF